MATWDRLHGGVRGWGMEPDPADAKVQEQALLIQTDWLHTLNTLWLKQLAIWI